MPRAPKQRVNFSHEEIDRFADRLRQEHVAVLRLSDGLSYEGISAELNIPIGTVRSRLNRARGRLSALLEQEAPNAGA